MQAGEGARNYLEASLLGAVGSGQVPLQLDLSDHIRESPGNPRRVLLRLAGENMSVIVKQSQELSCHQGHLQEKTLSFCGSEPVLACRNAFLPSESLMSVLSQ